MDLMKQIKVKIYDQEYVIKSDESAEQLNRIADYVNDKLKEIQDNTEGLSEKKMAILVALNIASEYFQAIKERDELSVNIRQRTEALLNNIDSVMDWGDVESVRVQNFSPGLETFGIRSNQIQRRAWIYKMNNFAEGWEQ